MTTRRPTLHSNKSRPLSAIFLGSISTPSHLPALPEPPPSPGADSDGSESGLPSPPATNSTGSGSNGDDTTNFGSVRQRPASYSHPHPDTSESTPSMPSAIYNPEIRSRSTTNINEEQHMSDDDEHDNDFDDGEDNTAKMDKRRSLKGSNENTMALQRVKSLAQRNRMALDKLSSISRLSSPSPSPSPVGNRAARSPMPPHSTTSSSSSTSSSRHAHSQSASVLQPRPRTASETPYHTISSSSNSRDYHRNETVLSGSETERDNHRLSLADAYSSDDQSNTPPSSASTSALRMTGMVPPITSPHRPRRISLPTSPGQAMSMSRTNPRQNADRSLSPGPSRTPRKRPTTTDPTREMSPEYDDRDASLDLTSAALAAVARSRSPVTLNATSGGSKGKRAPLPREFTGRDRRSLDGKSTGSADLPPQTPHRQPNRENTNVYLGRGSPSPQAAVASFAPGNPPRSPRGPKPGRSSTVRELTRRHQTRWLSEDLSGEVNGPENDEDGDGRRQAPRGGSMESPLGNLVGVRSLAGESLRAAGLKTKRDDVFGGGGEGRGADERSPAGGSGRAGEPSTASTKVSFDTRSGDQRRAHRASYNGIGSRPSTSLAESNHDRDQDSPGLGSSIHARQSTAKPSLPPDRAFTPSPFTTTRRHNSITPLPPRAGSTAPSQQQFSSSEHGCLMLESLQMFESNLTRLPPMGTTTTQTIPELFRSAQNIVNASDKLNALLRAGTNGALEEQIDAEVGSNDGLGGGEEIAEVWRRVGGEMRESLRVSDEIVRTMTGFLLGVGRVLKETAAAIGEETTQRSRSASIDEEFGGRRNATSPDVVSHGSGGRLSRDGRMSSGSRDSWELPPRTPGDTSLSKRLSTRVEPRPPSALNGNRDHFVRLDSHMDRETAPTPGPPKSGLAGTVRRLFTPREQRDHQVDPTISHEPSPTPITRNSTTLGRSRTLPPLSVPSPLPNLPSESPLPRNGSMAANAKSSRHRPALASISTVRGTSNPMFPSVATATTAISTGDETPFPLARHDSNVSIRSTNVTFSRPSTISISALNGLRKRTVSTTSSNAEEVSTSVQQVVSPSSAAEAGGDSRRKTVGARAAARMSLDSTANSNRNEGNQGTHRTMVPSNSAARRDRRRTVTEIFS
ncbi:hypothetical protein FIBSPDRAFT_863294 [Athelia psychrophila]|uniref:Uncharacterized protein n=1 Tax=Athelia psychrophila TaxID=1759441 RepID=A0A166HJS7_9AGAM|nr:hypothetical protein FIBSPDRAFT_863294 [Fibularhizoctonia sp. CBS 109695]